MALKPNFPLVPEKIVFSAKGYQSLMEMTLCHEEATPTNKWTIVRDVRGVTPVDLVTGDKTF